MEVLSFLRPPALIKRGLDYNDLIWLSGVAICLCRFYPHMQNPEKQIIAGCLSTNPAKGLTVGNQGN
jgi:hypothetical protein